MPREAFTEEALILKLGQFKEADCWIRFFTPTHGLLTGFAFGGLKSRKRFSGCLDPLSRVLLTAASDRYGRYLTLCEGSLINRYPSLHLNLSRWGMAVNCIKFLEASHSGAENASEIFAYTCKTLHLLDTQEALPPYVPMLYRAGLTSKYGYLPNLSQCSRCRQHIRSGDELFFFIAEGKTLCRRCCPNGAAGGQRMRSDLALFLLRLFTAEPEEWRSLHFPPQSTQMILHAIDRYVQAHIGLIWLQGRFQST
jgi:DNA repair protein RecO (recombination protein O)